MGKQVRLDPIEAAYERNKLANADRFVNPLNNLEDDSKYLKGFDAVNANSINDYKANRQGWGEALTNSLVKNTAKAGIRVVDGFAGLGTALADILTDNKLSSVIEGEDMSAKREGVSGFLETIYDNPFSQNVTRPFEKWLDETLPVYQTDAQQKSYNPLNLGFLDKTLDGVAYIAGMFGGAKAASLSAKGLGKIASLMSAAAREGKDLNYVKNLFANTDDLVKELGKPTSSGVADIARNVWDELFGAVVESGAEASETKKTIFENLKRDAILKNNGLPISKEQEAQLEKQASLGGAANFLTNLVTTGMANKVVFKPLLKTKWLDDVFENKNIQNDLINPNFIGKKGSEYILDKSAKNEKLYKKLFQNNIVKNAGIEGSQELVQFASNDYFVNLLSEPTKENVEDIAGLYDITTQHGLASFVKTMGNLGSVDAIHSAMIGGLIGGGAGALQDFSNRGVIDKNTQYAIDYANRNSLNNKDVTSAIQNFAKAKEYSQLADAAVKNGDRVTYETAKYLGFANYVNARVNMNKFEDVIADLTELKQKPLEEFKEQFDLGDYKTFDATKRDKMIDYALDVANQIKSSQDKIMSNYGHKINALEAKNPDNKRLLPFLTSLDALKSNYTKREQELIDKFKANGVDYSAFQKKEKSEEEFAAAQGRIQELQGELSLLQADTNLDTQTKLEKIGELSNQILKATNELQNSVTEKTYKELFKRELTDEYKPAVDDKAQKFLYETFSKDLNDFVDIQTAKEGIIDIFSKITKDESYAEKVSNKLRLRKDDTEISKLFSISGNVINNPTISKEIDKDTNEEREVSKDNYEFEEGEAKSPESYREDYIRTGDVYQLNRKIYRDSAKGEAYEMFEVIDTKTTTLPDGSLRGEVRISNNKGYKEWMDVRDFKRSIKPMGNSTTSPIKMNNKSEEYQFYQKYKNRGIKFQHKGKTYIGKLSLPYADKNKDGKKLYATPNTYNLLYLDENGKRQTFRGFKFDDRTSLQYEILSEELSTLLDLKLNVEQYISILNKSIKTIQDSSIPKLKEKLQNVIDGKNIDNLSKDLKDLLESDIQLQIEENQSFIEGLQEAVKNLSAYQDENVEVNPDIEIPEDIKKALDKVAEFRELNKQLSETEARKLLQEKIKVLKSENEVLTNQVAENVNTIVNSLQPADKVIVDRNPDKIGAVIELINKNEELRNSNEQFLDLYKALLAKEIEYKTALSNKEKDLYNSIANSFSKPQRPLDVQAVKLGELDTLISFWDFITNKGYRYSSGFGKTYSKDFQEDYNTEVSYRTEANNEDIVKTKAPSDYSLINGDYEVEKQNFFKYFYKVPVDSKDPIELEVEVVEDTIYLKFEHEGIPMVTTLAASAKDSTPLGKFRKELKAAYTANLAEGKKTFISPNGKISLFEKGFENKPIKEVFGDIDYYIKVIAGSEGEKEVEYPIAGVTYNLKNGRPYVVNEKLGIVQPLIVGTLDEAKIKDKQGNVYSLTDTIFKNIEFLNAYRTKASDVDYQKHIGYFYSNLNSFVYTAKHDAIGTDKGLKKGAIDIVEKDGDWILVYLDADGKKQMIYMFDENGINPLAKEQIGRRLVNPKLEALTEDGFKYENQFKPFLTYGIGKDGIPYPVLKSESDYTYETFLKESAGLKSNLAVQNVSDKPTYFKGGYFTFNSNEKAKKETVEKKELKAKSSLAEAGKNIAAALGMTEAPKTETKKSSLADIGKNIAGALGMKPAVNANAAFGATEKQAAAVDEDLTQEDDWDEENDTTTENPVAASIGQKFQAFNSKFKAETQSDEPSFFQPSSLKIAKTNKYRNITKEELESARVRFEEKYGVNFNLVNGLINSFAWGRVTEAGDILISNTAPVGTDYHEEFHLVSQHILSTSELNDLYTDARNKYGNVSDYELEEILAEGFRMYALGYNGFLGKIQYYFNKLLSAIKSLVGIKNTPINELYADILAGKYYNKPVYEGTVRNSEVLNYDEKQKIFGDISKTVLELIKTEGLQGNKTKFVQFIDDSYYRQQMLNETIDPEIFNSDPIFKEVVTKNNGNVVATYFNLAAINYAEHLEANEPLIAAKLYNSYSGFDTLLKDSKSYFNNLLKTNIEEEIDEDVAANTKEVVKKGDAETDFFTGSLTKLRLLIVNESDGTAFGHLNPATFIGMIYNHIRDLNSDISTYENFEANLVSLLDNPKLKSRYGKEYVEGLRNIINLLNINKSLPAKANKHYVNLQNLLFEVFSKVENEFQILKVIDTIDEGNPSIARAFVNQTIEKQYDDLQKRVRSSIIDYLVSNKPKISKIDPLEISKIGNELFGTTYFTPELFSGTDKADTRKRDQMFHIINDIIDGKISKTAKSKTEFDKILDYNKSSIDEVVSKIATAEGLDKIFNIRNAEGSPQYSLSNYSSLHKRLEDYKKKSNPVKSDLEFTGLTLMNGVQTKGEETDSITANKLNRNDILLYFIESVLKDGVMPYAFSGDKSTLLGIRTTGSLLKNNTDYASVYSKLLDKEIAFVNAFNGKKPFEKMKLEFPLFEFLKDKNKGLYERLLKNPIDNRQEAIDALIEHIDKKAAKLKEEVIKITGNDIYPLDDLKKFYHLYTISIAEQTNELTGSLNFYSDFAKRAYAISSTKINLRLDKKFVDWYNGNYSNGIYNIESNSLKSLILDDVERKAYTADLGDFDNAADAQGYMYYHSARFMLMSSGRWNEKLDRIFKDLDRLEAKETLTKSDIDEHNNLVSELNEQVSVLKPQYFGYQEYNGIDVPTFYKLSVLPLSKVVTNNKNLDAIRKTMKDKGIDLVMFASANKVGRKIENGTLSMYDTEGNFNFNPDAIEDYLQVSDWKYMGIQVEMPLAHETVTFGTQFRKLITESIPDGIVLDDRDEPYTANEIIKKHEKLILKKIESDTNKFKERFKLQDDFTFGEEVKESDRREFKKQLIEQATSREVPESFIQSLKDNNSWDYIMNKSTLQKILNASIRNNIITQKMSGDAKAMVSSVGFEKKGDSIKYDNRLKFYEKGINGNDSIEILLPFQYKDAYEKYVTFEDGYYIIKEDAPKNLIDLVGYRIPTQGHASIDKLRIKGFLPESYGNAIVVPFELSKKAGSDFDIDKLNIFFPKLKDGKYNSSAVENEILNLYTQILSSHQYRELLMTSIDNSEIKDFIKDEIEVIQGTSKNNAGYLMFDPVNAVDRRYSFMTAKSTLGSVALHATHHAESQKHQLGFIAASPSGATNKLNGVSLIDTLNVFESGREITKKNKSIIPLYNLNSSLKRGNIFVKISDILSQFMNATVDAAKDDYITSANFDLTTVNTALMLIRIGLHPKEVLMFISNKAIKEYSALMKAKNDLTYDTSDINDKIGELKSKASKASYPKLTSDNIADTLKTADYGMLKLYLDLEQWSNVLSNLMNISNFDTKGNGKSIEENEYRQRKFQFSQKEFTNYIANYKESANPDTSFQSAFREVAFKANNFTGLAFGLNKLYYAQNTDNTPKFPAYHATLNKIAYNEEVIVGYDFENKPILRNLSTDDRTYKANRFKQMFLTALLQYNIVIKNKGKQPDMKQLYKTIKDTLPEGSYLKNKLQLTSNAEGKAGQYSISLNNGAGLAVDEANRITEAFEQLYRNSPQLAKDLATFSLFQSGVINSPVTLYHIIPEHIIKEISLIDTNNKNMFDELLNQAQTYSKEEVVAKLVKSVDTKFFGAKSKYDNKMLSVLALNNIKSC